MSVITLLRLPPVLAAGAVALQVVLTRSSRRSVPTSVLGGVVAAAGGALAFAGHHEFTKASTTANPSRPEDASALVTGGVFRYTRNPMYLGLVLVQLGHALHRRDPRALIPVAGFVAAIDRTQIPHEEAALSSRFGDAYRGYRGDVRRWV